MIKHPLHIVPFWIVGVLLMALLILMSSSVWYYRYQEEQYCQTVLSELASIAHLKAKLVAAWRADQLEDAALLVADPLFARGAASILGKDQAPPAQEFRAVVSLFKNSNDLSNILLVDPQGVARFNLQDIRHSVQDYEMALRSALRERRPIFNELHTGSEQHLPHFSVVVPIFEGNAPGSRPRGAVVLICNAEQYLYPLLRFWPTVSRSAETYLVQRAGDSVLFLSDVRHRKHAALHLAFPLTRKDVSAVTAVAGGKRTFAGKDYRGVNVLTAVAQVAGSPWYMLAEIDTDEVMVAWRHRSHLFLAMLFALVGCLLAGGVAVWQRYRTTYFKSMLAAERQLFTSAARHSITLRSIGDAVISTDAVGRVELMNPVAEMLTGWSHAEAFGVPLTTVFPMNHEGTRQSLDEFLADVLLGREIVGHISRGLLITRDGRELPVAATVTAIRNEEHELAGIVLTFRDKTDERRYEALRDARVSLLEYAADHSLAELLQRALDLTGELVGSPIAFYHFIAADQQSIFLQQWSTRTVREFCRADGHRMHYDLHCAGVWADSVRTRQAVMHNDYASLPNRKGLPPGHAPVQRELVVPIIRDDRVVAILGVGNKAENYTDKDLDAVVYLADVTWEIIDRKRADEALHQSEEQHRLLFETMSQGVVYQTADGAITKANPAAERILGLTRDEITGRTSLDGSWQSIHEDGSPFLDDEHPVMVAQRTGQSVGPCLMGVFNPVRMEHVWISIMAMSFSPPGDAVPGQVYAMFEDISEQRKAEKNYHVLFQEMLDGFALHEIITDEQGTPVDYRFLEINPAFERMTGLRKEDLLGKTVRQAIPSVEPFWIETYGTVALTGNPVMFEHYSPEIGKYLEMKAYRPAAKQFACVFADITRRKRAEEEHEQLQAQLQEARRIEAIGRLAGGIAHDFNNMLSVILGHAEMALMKLDPGNPRYDDLLQIRDAAQRSAALTRQLLGFARRQTIMPKVLDLNGTVEGMLVMLRRLIGEDITLHWQPGAAVWPVKMDPSQLDQILANLCVNARDAIAGTGTVTIATDQAVLDEASCLNRPGFAPGEYALLVISDTGCGMDQETLDKVFEPFYTTKEFGEGTGLGMSTVYGIVKQNNGSINVYSEPGHGTTVRIYLPRHQQTPPQETVAAPSALRGGHETILLVEDEPAILEVGRVMLQGFGYRVLTAGSPESAMALAAENADSVALLISDVIMPTMHGRALADHVQKICPGLRCLFMSGYPADVIARQGVLDEGLCFIAKPFSMQTLASKVRAVLDGAVP